MVLDLGEFSLVALRLCPRYGGPHLAQEWPMGSIDLAANHTLDAVLDQYPRSDLSRCCAHVAPSPPIWKCVCFCDGRPYLYCVLVQCLGLPSFLRCAGKEHRKVEQR